jgi:hypothetical protein
MFFNGRLASKETYDIYMVLFICIVSLPIVRPLPPKTTSLIRPDFRCTKVVKYHQIVLLKERLPL